MASISVIGCVCAICGKPSVPNADVVKTGVWICDECGERLRKLLYSEDKKDESEG